MYGAGEKTFQGRILSAESGLPIAATVSVRGSNGVDINLDGEHEFVDYLGKKRWYVDGSFRVTTMEDSLFIEIRCGLETYPVKEMIDLSDAASKVKEFQTKTLDQYA